MAKGEILEHLGDCKYRVKVLYNRTLINVQIEKYDDTLRELEIAKNKLIRQEESTAVIDIEIELVKKSKNYLLSHTPEDFEVEAYCSMYLEFPDELTGIVALAVVPSIPRAFVIFPGYWEPDEGELVPSIAFTGPQMFYLMCLHPAYRKWFPKYRAGVINSISGGYCTLTLEPAYVHYSEINLNQENVLTNVYLDALNCPDIPFKAGDRVLVTFSHGDFSSRAVIGFVENPRKCAPDVVEKYFSLGSFSHIPVGGNVVWDTEDQKLRAIVLPKDELPRDSIRSAIGAHSNLYWGLYGPPNITEYYFLDLHLFLQAIIAPGAYSCSASVSLWMLSFAGEGYANATFKASEYITCSITTDSTKTAQVDRLKLQWPVNPRTERIYQLRVVVEVRYNWGLFAQETYTWPAVGLCDIYGWGATDHLKSGYTLVDMDRSSDLSYGNLDLTPYLTIT